MSIINIIKSIFLGMSIYTSLKFKSKCNSDERNIYINNANKIRKIIALIIEKDFIENDCINELKFIYHEAKLCLNKEIVEFTNDILTLVIKLQKIQIELSIKIDDERMGQLLNNKEDIMNRLNYYNNISLDIYRKCIVSEPINDLKEFFKNFINKSNYCDYKKI